MYAFTIKKWEVGADDRLLLHNHLPEKKTVNLSVKPLKLDLLTSPAGQFEIPSMLERVGECSKNNEKCL